MINNDKNRLMLSSEELEKISGGLNEQLNELLSKPMPLYGLRNPEDDAKVPSGNKESELSPKLENEKQK